MSKLKKFNPLDWVDKDKNEHADATSKQHADTNGKQHADANNLRADTAADMREIAHRLASHGTDITQGYDNWLRLGFAIACEMGEAGRETFHELSRVNAQYNQKECDRQYSACLKSHGGGVTANTFFMMAKNAGFDLADYAREKKREIWNSGGNTANAANAALPQSYKKNEKIDNSLIIKDGSKNRTDCGNCGNCANEDLSDSEESFGTMSFSSTFSDKTGQNVWCKFLQPIINNMDDSEGRDKILLGALAVVSGILPNIYGCYGGHVVYPPLYFIFYGAAASRKGELRSCLQVLKPIKTETRRGYEAEMAQYNEDHSRWEAMGGRSLARMERGPEPREPKFRSPLIPANSSASAAYQALEANGGSGVMFETEADVLTQSLLSDYGDYSAGLRAAFHHEPIMMSRIKDKLHIEIEEPRLAVCLTCTPGQLPKLFPSFENGLGSRFLFYGLNRRVEWLDPFRKDAAPLDDVLAEMGRDALRLHHRMRELGERRIQFVLSKSQQQRFNEFFSGLLMEQFSMLGDGITSFIFRMGLSAFRMAMILSLLRRHSDTPDIAPLFDKGEQVLQCCDADLDTALTIMDTLVNHTALIYSSLAKEGEEQPLKVKVDGRINDRLLALYKALPEEFTTKEFYETVERNGYKARTSQRHLKQLVNDYRLLERVKFGHYRKRK